MKATLVFVGLFLLAAAVAQQQDESGPKGVIHGTVIPYGQKTQTS
jgi:hypothetical protein